MTAPLKCVILGDGNHRADCERLSERLGLADRVKFVGFVPQARIAAYYHDASLAVMSSVWPEPFGATGLEAMRCGLPVVAFDAGGIREWLTDGVNGFSFRGGWIGPPSPRGWTPSCSTRIALAASGPAAGNSLRRHFNFDAYIGGSENLFIRMAGQPTPADPQLLGT